MTEGAAATLTVRDALAPFNRNDADFVLTTSDGIQFRVFRAILTLASESFEGMFGIPQPQESPPIGNSQIVSTPSESSSVANANIPGVSISEDSETMDTFLRICYPHTTAEIEVDSLSHLHKILIAGNKYQCLPVVDAMRKALVQPRFLKNETLRVFAIAYDLDLEEEAKEAAKMAVVDRHVPIIGDAQSPELDDVNAGAYHRLMRLHKTWSQGRRLEFNDIEPICRRPIPLPADETTEIVVAHPFDSGDIILRTSDSVDYMVQLHVLQVVAPEMLEIINRDVPQQGPPVYNMRERSAVVAPLLRFCYPRQRLRLTYLSNLFPEVLATLKKYQLNEAADEAIQAHWSSFAEMEPFRFFFHAIALNMADEARSCARLIAQSPDGKVLLSLYVPEMENTSSLAYRRLLSYVSNYREAATANFQLIQERPCDQEGCACRSRCPSEISTRAPPPEFVSVFQKMKDMIDKEPCGKTLSVGSLVGLIMDGMDTQSASTRTSQHWDFGPNAPNTPREYYWGNGQNSSSSNVYHRASMIHTPPEFYFLCSMSTRHRWASGLLKKYADAVDRAVSQVELNLSGVLP